MKYKKDMKNRFNIAVLIFVLGLASCETSEDVSNGLDHQVPECKSITLTVNGQTKVIDDNISSLLLWSVVPQKNLEKNNPSNANSDKGFHN